MKSKMSPRVPLFGGSVSGSQTLGVPFSLSFVAHILFFTLLILSPITAPKKYFSPSVVNVSLVALPALPESMLRPAPAVAATVPEETPAVATAPEDDATPEALDDVQAPETVKPTPAAPANAISLAPSKKTKTSLKKKTFKPSRVIKSALAKIEKDVQSQKPKTATKAINQLKKKAAATPPIQTAKSGAQTSTTATRETTATTAAGNRGAELIDLYKLDIAYQVEKNWAFPEQLAGGSKNLESLLMFKVMPTGAIKDLFFTQRSGNNHLDESARRAILKSDPVRPHPKGIQAPYVIVGLRFTPEGVR
jgi:colicin import membrane protein